MTICIGALCDNGHTVVVASDRMVTSNFPPIEFEHTKEKTYELSKQCVALTAGNALRPIEIIPPIKSMLQNLKSPGIDQIADAIKGLYQKLRAEVAEEIYLKPRTITKEVFYSRGASLFPHDLFNMIDNQLLRVDLGLVMILAGVDGSGAHIYSIRNPGIAECYDTIGFHAIGIGELHSIQTFIAHRYKTTYNSLEALTIVYAAKRAAEVAPGVGGETDIAIINASGIIHLDKTIIGELSKIYDETKKPLSDEIALKCERLREMMSKESSQQEESSKNLGKVSAIADTAGKKKQPTKKTVVKEAKP